MYVSYDIYISLRKYELAIMKVTQLRYIAMQMKYDTLNIYNPHGKLKFIALQESGPVLQIFRTLIFRTMIIEVVCPEQWWW